MFQSVRVAAGAWLLAIYYRQSWKKNVKSTKSLFFQNGTWRQVATSRCRWRQMARVATSRLQPLAATCPSSHLQPLAATCSQLPKQPQVAASGCKWLHEQAAASGCKSLQVAASDCVFEKQNDARLLPLCIFGFPPADDLESMIVNDYYYISHIVIFITSFERRWTGGSKRTAARRLRQSQVEDPPQGNPKAGRNPDCPKAAKMARREYRAWHGMAWYGNRFHGFSIFVEIVHRCKWDVHFLDIIHYLFSRARWSTISVIWTGRRMSTSVLSQILTALWPSQISWTSNS